MYELLRVLPLNAYVLDLGSAGGSFDDSDRFVPIRVDLEYRPEAGRNFVVADAAQLPLPSDNIDLIIANHSLEHFDNLYGCLREIRRVTKPTGGLFVSVPDASTLTDKLYRWLARGGGHVNPFTSAAQLAALIQEETGLIHKGTRTLCTSLSFLNRNNCRARAPRKLLLLGGGTETSLLTINYLFRLMDAIFRTRTCVYGWALYFGSLVPEGAPGDVWTNVCIRCGSGHPSPGLLNEGRVKTTGFSPVRLYRCPCCATLNAFTDDQKFDHLGHEF